MDNKYRGPLGRESCATCGKKAKLICSRCRASRYCGRDCQHAGWARHKHVCRALGTFAAARGAMADALRGGDSPLIEESVEQLGELATINELGVLTDDSQPGLNENDDDGPVDRELYARLWRKYNDEFIASLAGCDFGGSAYADAVFDPLRAAYLAEGGQFAHMPASKQRAYVCGYAEPELAQAICTMLNQTDHVFAFSVRPGAPDSGIRCPVTYVPYTQDGGFSRSEEYPLVPFTHIPTEYIPVSESMAPYTLKALAIPWGELDPHLVAFSAMDTRYGHHVRSSDGLFKSVIRALKVAS